MSIIAQRGDFDKIEITFLNSYKGPIDRFFPRVEITNKFRIANSTLADGTRVAQYRRIVNMAEENYLNLMKEIVESGNERLTRNSITRSVFGRTLSFDLKNGFPLLTTKRVRFRVYL